LYIIGRLAGVCLEYHVGEVYGRERVVVLVDVMKACVNIGGFGIHIGKKASRIGPAIEGCILVRTEC
jgi:hypothetical protein